MENKEQEIWRVIEEFPNYSVSNWGNVRNDKTGRVLKPELLKKGYHRIKIGKSYKDRRLVHRLVADVFVNNKNNKPYINHIDGNKINNFYKNLEWVTIQENNIHSRTILKQCQGETFTNSKLSEFDVLLACEIIKTNTFAKTAKLLGGYIDGGTIASIAYGQTWTHTTDRLKHIPYKKDIKLTNSLVEDICIKYSQGIKVFEIAKLLNIKTGVIHDIIHGRNHRKITQDLKYLPYHNK